MLEQIKNVFKKNEENDSKVKIFRHDGKPVLLKHLNVYEKKLNLYYKKCIKKYGECGKHNVHKYHEYMDKRTQELLKAYPNYYYINLPKNKVEMQKLLNDFGAVGFTFEQNEKDEFVIVAYIMTDY